MAHSLQEAQDQLIVWQLLAYVPGTYNLTPSQQAIYDALMSDSRYFSDGPNALEEARANVDAAAQEVGRWLSGHV